MNDHQPLRGGCQCGRNQYLVRIPRDTPEIAQILFDTGPLHQVPLGTPLAAFIRVPLSWYRSSTHAYFPDETAATIHRVYSHPGQGHSQRHFCGFCGTPLSYWSEEPRSEADYIHLTLGSLLGQDLRDLEDLGLIPDADDPDQKPTTPTTPTHPTTAAAVAKESLGVPWFDSMVDGSRLGKMRRTQGVGQSKDGNIRVEWEIVEWTEDEPGTRDIAADVEATNPAKRKLWDRDDA